jgi:pimeloyl-ACP methyl ester carboxylesterase
LIQELGIEKPMIVGHSWSGSVVLAYLLDYPDETTGGVLLAGGSHPWKGGVAWYNDIAGIPLLGELFARTLVYPFGRVSMKTAISNVFAPNPVPEKYIERTGVQLSLRPTTFLANAEDIRMLSDYLAVQSQALRGDKASCSGCNR